MIYEKLLKFQKMGITLKKDGENPHFKSSYVTLNEVLDKVKKPLNDLGIVILQSPVGSISGGGEAGLLTVLHDTEDATEAQCFMPYVDAGNSQKLGSANTYLRRYSLITLLGLEDEDDDGNKASTGKPEASKGVVGRNDEPFTIEDDFSL